MLMIKAGYKIFYIIATLTKQAEKGWKDKIKGANKTIGG